MSKKATHDKLAAKKAAVLGTRRRNRTPLVAGLAVLVLIAASAAWYFGSSTPKAQVSQVAGVQVSGEAVSIPVSTFDDRKAHYFEHKNGNVTIRYFVIKSADGVVRAAFDACDVCWPTGKGYVQDGDYMVCRNCGQRFHSTKVNEVRGGCNPAPLERRVENGTVTIRLSDIVAGITYFDLPRKG
jgi:uncharacterized membrane protein